MIDILASAPKILRLFIEKQNIVTVLHLMALHILICSPKFWVTDRLVKPLPPCNFYSRYAYVDK